MKILYVILILCIKYTISAPRCLRNISYQFLPENSPFQNFVIGYTDYSIKSFLNINYFGFEYFNNLLRSVVMSNENWESIQTPRQYCQSKYSDESLADMSPMVILSHFYLNKTQHDLSRELLYPNQYPEFKIGGPCKISEQNLRTQIRIDHQTFMIQDYYTYIQNQVTEMCDREKFNTPLQFCEKHIK